MWKIGSAGRDSRRSVFKQLLLTMLAFGAAVGLLFPPFSYSVLGTEGALSVGFFMMCVGAGLLVGAANFLLFKVVVFRELSRVVAAMNHVNKVVAVAQDSGSGRRDDCRVAVTSDDLIGEAAESFNSMTEAIGRRIEAKTVTRGLLAELSTTVDLETVSSGILESLARVCNAKGGALFADTGTRFELVSCFGMDTGDDAPDGIDTSQGLTERAISTGDICHISPSRDGYEWVHMSSPLGSLRPESLALVPLMAEQRATGLVVLACSDAEMAGDRAPLVDAIRTQAAPYLHNAVLHRKLEDLAAIDELTRVLNRRFGMRRMSEEFSRATRNGVPLSILMIDIDHFRVFNDTFGRDAGDTVLVGVVSILEQNVRAGDIVCRYGGGKLLIVAPGMGLSDAAAVADRLRRVIEGTPTQRGERLLHVSVSIGAASWPVAHVSTAEELVTSADEALHHAKNGGRNAVSLHQGDSVIPLSLLRPERSEPLEDSRSS